MNVVIGPLQPLLVFWWIAVPLLLLTGPALIMARRDYYGSDFWPFTAILSLICSGVAIVVGLALHFPLDAKYWSLYEATGTVMNVTNSFEDGGDYTARSWVVELEGQNTVYVLDDPRAATLDLGDKVDLTCSIQWVYQSQDRINCTIDGIERGVATDTVEVIP